MLSEPEKAVLSLATEDAFALGEIAAEVGGDVAVAAAAVKRLLRLGFVEIGVEEWSADGQPAFIADGEYLAVPLVGDADEVLVRSESWGADEARKIVVWSTPAGNSWYFGSRG